MNTQNPRDLLFYQLACDLSQDIVDDTQSAAEQTISLTSQFLDKDSQQLVTSFQQHCTKNKTTNESFVDAVKDNVQQVVEKNDAIRSEVKFVLSSMQFSELLRQHLAGLCNSFEIMTRSASQNPDETRNDMFEQMHTFDERKAFYDHVLHQDMPSEDMEVDQDLIDQLIG